MGGTRSDEWRNIAISLIALGFSPVSDESFSRSMVSGALLLFPLPLTTVRAEEMFVPLLQERSLFLSRRVFVPDSWMREFGIAERTIKLWRSSIHRA
jgi:hypothetical protein